MCARRGRSVDQCQSRLDILFENLGPRSAGTEREVADGPHPGERPFHHLGVGEVTDRLRRPGAEVIGGIRPPTPRKRWDRAPALTR